MELMFVVALMAILAGIATPYYQSFVSRTEGKKVEQEMKILEREILSFYLANNRYPDDLAEIGMDGLMDPWGNPYQYLNVDALNSGKKKKGKGKSKDKAKVRKDHSLHPVNTDFDLYSMGPDGRSQAPFTAKNSRDDYVRANNGAFFGYVSDY